MAQGNQTLWEQCLILLNKSWIYITSIFVGMVGQFSYRGLRGEKYTLWQNIFAIGVALFVGFIASYWCSRHNPDNTPYIVPVATLLSDKIMIYLMTKDWHKIYRDVHDLLSKKS